MNNAATATARTASPVRKLTYSALFLALAMVLPFLTGQIPEIGSMLCPMHIPALLCGFMCGWPWGTRGRLYLPAAALDVRYASDLGRHPHGL